MTMLDNSSSSQTFAPALRAMIAITAVIDLLVGLAWLLGPELGLTLWPTQIPPALMRFIGAIVFANGIGALMIVRRPTWENARTLFTVAFVYGILVLLGLLYQLLALGGPSFLWLYIAVDVIFLVPIGYIIWLNERGSAVPQATPAQAIMWRAIVTNRLSLVIVASICLLGACGSTPVAVSPSAAPAQATAAPAPTAAPLTPTAAPAPTAAPRAAQTGPVVIAGAGASPADIQAKVDEYRQLLGLPNNQGQPGTQPAGHREINWDGLPDDLAAPNDYLADFFNDAKPPRARGALLSTPGTALVVSADSDNPSGASPRFGHINDSYSNIFTAFSGERMFSPIGSNIVDLTFYVPGTNTPAVVRGFGAVYADVDTDHTAFEYFDATGKSLGQFKTPIANNGLSFLGVAFPEPVVHRVRIAYGTAALGPDDGPNIDVAVMDDFIYGEPHAVR